MLVDLDFLKERSKHGTTEHDKGMKEEKCWEDGGRKRNGTGSEGGEEKGGKTNRQRK